MLQEWKAMEKPDEEETKRALPLQKKSWQNSSF